MGILQTALPDLTPAGISGSIPGLEEGGTDPWTFSPLKNADQLKGRTGGVTQHTSRPLASPFPAKHSLGLNRTHLLETHIEMLEETSPSQPLVFLLLPFDGSSSGTPLSRSWAKLYDKETRENRERDTVSALGN